MTSSAFLAFTLLLPAGGVNTSLGVDPPAKKAYASILAKHVKNGLVDYAQIAKSSRKQLDTYLEAVANAKLPDQRADRMAFYIDAYNALVIRSVINHGRPRSVLDVKGFFKEKVHRVANITLSLDELEKKHLNPFAQDPRTHFVLVCAAVGCPILESQPYADSPLEARLEAATRRYLGAPAGARIKPGELALSKIFDWYKADFGGEDQVLPFVRNYLTAQDKALLGPSPRISYVDYNWTLNQP